MRTAHAYCGDLSDLAIVHAAAFPGFYLTRMGPWFLRAYYQAVRDFPGGILLGIEDAEGLAGFAAGFVDPAEFYRFYRSRRVRLLLPFLVGVARRPGLLAHSLRNIASVRQRAQVGVPEATTECELSSIAVVPRAAGQGLGRVLVDAFCAEAARRGAAGVVLTTDRDDNDPVNRFYLRLGFAARSERLTGGRAMTEYYRRLGGEAPHEP